jgi:hypothetical protein
VENDLDLKKGYNSMHTGTSDAITYLPKYKWVDHLLGVFCVNVSKRKMHNEGVRPEIPVSSEVRCVSQGCLFFMAIASYFRFSLYQVPR